MHRGHQVVAITGASAGVGRATALLFASKGADVALLGREPDALKETRDEIEKIGARAIDVPTDVSDYEQVLAAVETVESELGPVDVWVNNAMVSVFAPFLEMSAKDFAQVNDITYLGFVNCTHAAMRRMVARDRGCIVQVGSALAYRGIPLQSAYCGAKHAIQGFTESVRCELLHNKSRVKITMVQLPALNTPQFHWVKTNFDKHPQPVPPIFQPEVAADAIWWASRHRRREVSVGASSALSILANKVAPGLLDRYLGRTGYASQQADWPIEPNRPDNLYDPVPGAHRTHGEFGHLAKRRSLHWSANKHRVGLAAAVGMLGTGAWRAMGGSRS